MCCKKKNIDVVALGVCLAYPSGMAYRYRIYYVVYRTTCMYIYIVWGPIVESIKLVSALFKFIADHQDRKY